MTSEDYSPADALQSLLISTARQSHIYQTYQSSTDLEMFRLWYRANRKIVILVYWATG